MKVSSRQWAKVTTIARITTPVRRKYGADSREANFLERRLRKLPMSAIILLELCSKLK